MRNRLRVLRAIRMVTQAELASLISVSRQTVHAVESGKYEPSLSLAFKMSQIFGIPIEEIFYPDNVPAEDLPELQVPEPPKRSAKPKRTKDTE